MRYCQLAILSLLLHVSMQVCAETTPPLILHEEVSRYDVAPYMDIFSDDTGELTLVDVRSTYADQFKRNTMKVFGDGGVENRNRYYWIRFRLVSEIAKPFLADTWLIDIDRPLLREVNFYIISSLNEVQSHIGGSIYPFENRVIDNVHHVYPLTVLPGEEVQVYIRVRSEGPLVVPIRLWSESEFIENESETSFWAGSFYGILLIMVLYNLVVFFSTRDPAYLYYVLFVCALLMTLASLDGYTFKYLWPNWPAWNGESVFIGGALSVIACVKFTIVFLELRKEDYPVLTEIYRKVFILSILLLPAQLLLETRAFAALCIISFLTLMIGNLISSLYVTYRGTRIGYFSAFAWCLPILGAVTYLLAVMALVQNAGNSEIWFKVGFVVQTAIFSAGLADKINGVRKDNEKLQGDSLRSEKESNRLKDEFMATISHELRTPMNGVVGALTLMKTHEGLPQELAEYIRIAESSSENMMELIQGILDFTEIQAGRVKIVEEDFCLHESINEMHAKFKPKAEEKGLDFSLIYGGIHQDIWVQADIKKITYILDRLVDNAIKFTDRGKVDLKVIANQMSKGSLWMTFEVEDTGVGISKHSQQKMFDAFRQLDGTFSRRYGGMGIGLALSNKFAELIDTRLELDSVEGQGTRFWFSLPIKVIEPKTVAIRVSKEDSQPKNLEETDSSSSPASILIVEDNRVNQVVLKKLVEKLGYGVCTAENGEQALEILDEQQVNLILMDCQMPVMDGFEATRVIRNKECNYSKIPIIAVTANVSSEDEANCYNVGMNDFVTKPFERTVIEKKITQWI